MATIRLGRQAGNNFFAQAAVARDPLTSRNGVCGPALQAVHRVLNTRRQQLYVDLANSHEVTSDELALIKDLENQRTELVAALGLLLKNSTAKSLRENLPVGVSEEELYSVWRLWEGIEPEVKK